MTRTIHRFEDYQKTLKKSPEVTEAIEVIKKAKIVLCTPEDFSKVNEAQPLSEGAEVKELQSLLIGLGYMATSYKNAKGQIVPMNDGKFGPRTRASVVSFQQKNGLVTDGIVGKKTVTVLLDKSKAAEPKVQQKIETVSKENPTFAQRLSNLKDEFKESINRIGQKIDNFFDGIKDKVQAIIDNIIGDPKKIDPKVTDSKNAHLKFDGTYLYWMVDGVEKKMWQAVSGITPWNSGKFDRYLKDPKEWQKIKDQGPTPEGEYEIRDLQSRDGQTSYSKLDILSNAYKAISGQKINTDWKSGGAEEQIAWGNYRGFLYPLKGTETFGRNNMYIHGGGIPGSHGCIDLTGYMDDFAHHYIAWQAKTGNKKIGLTVQYNQPEATKNLWSKVWQSGGPNLAQAQPQQGVQQVPQPNQA